MFTLRRPLAGETTKTQEPTWEPLLELASEHIDDFMWMFEVELEDGTKVQAYKHWWTRRYLHLTDELRAYVYGEGSIYYEVWAEDLLELVLPKEKLSIPGYTEDQDGESDGFDAR